jgi:hypothetical protein
MSCVKPTGRPGDIWEACRTPKEYPLPKEVPEDSLVKLIRFDHGYWDVEYRGKVYHISDTRLDPPGHRKASYLKVRRMMGEKRFDELFPFHPYKEG